MSGSTSLSLNDYANAVCETGLPGIYRQSPRLRRQLINAYIQRVIDRDVPNQGLMVRKPESLRAWWAAYAAASSTTTSYTKILNAASPGESSAKVSHQRTQGSAQDVGLILERYDGKVVAFEVNIKPTPTDRDVRHLHWLEEQIGPRLVEKVIATTGTDAYRRPDGVAVVPLALLW